MVLLIIKQCQKQIHTSTDKESKLTRRDLLLDSYTHMLIKQTSTKEEFLFYTLINIKRYCGR